MPDERAAAEQVVAFWDALVLDRPTDGIDVEEDLAAALRRFQEMGAVSPGTARERVWEGLRPGLGVQTWRGGPPIPRPVRRLSHPGSADGAGTPRPRRDRPYWVLSQLATAALLILTLGLGYLTLGPGASHRSEPTAVPANAAVATPDPGPILETVFATTLPADRMPPAGVHDFLLTRLSLDPGASAPVAPEVQACCSGPQITHVLEGVLTVRVDGPMQVFRGGALAGSLEAEPGTDVVLQPGDTVVFDFALPTDYANRGTSPVQLVTAGLYRGILPGPWTDHMAYVDGNEDTPLDPLPGPAEIRLVRARVPPDGVVPAPAPGALMLEVGAEGDAAIATRADDGSLRNIGDETETIYVLTIAPVDERVVDP